MRNRRNIFSLISLKYLENGLKLRPKGNQNNYRIYTDKEEQDGFDSSVSVTVLCLRSKTYNPLDC